jgi:hypothetical protein
MGPAMKALPNDKWRAAAVARFEVRTNTEAAQLAGYCADNPNSLRRVAYGLFHDDRMLRALHELGAQHLANATPDAIAAFREIIGNPDHKDRLAAARFLVEHAHPRESLSRLVVEHKVDFTKQALEELTAWRKLGLPREKLEAIYGKDGLWHLEQQLDATAPKLIDVTPASAP